jgi:hypothetical protein
MTWNRNALISGTLFGNAWYANKPRTSEPLPLFCGFTTKDLARCRLAARLVALVYNWWNLFTRLAGPDKHLEAITSRPLLLTAIAERIRHARQTTLRVASSHGRAAWASSALAGIAAFLGGLVTAAEQLTPIQRWYRILSHALRHFLKGRALQPPARLPAPAA